MIPIAQLHIIGPCCGYVTSLLAPCRAGDYGQEASSKQRNPSGWGYDDDLGSHASSGLCEASIRHFFGKRGKSPSAQHNSTLHITLALGTLASRRWGPIGLHGMADQHAHTALALGARDGWNGPFVPRAVQVVSDSGRRALLHRLSVRRAQRPACQPRHLGRAVALVELVAPSQPERSRDTCRLACPPRPDLAGLCHSSRDGGGMEGIAAERPGWHSLRRNSLAAGHGEASGIGIHVTSPWPPKTPPSRPLNGRTTRQIDTNETRPRFHRYQQKAEHGHAMWPIWRETHCPPSQRHIRC